LKFIARFKTDQMIRFIKFSFVGLSGVVVNEGIFALFTEVLLRDLGIGTRNFIAGVVAILVSILTNFLLNDSWTWRDRRTHGKTAFAKRLVKYYAVAGIG